MIKEKAVLEELKLEIDKWDEKRNDLFSKMDTIEDELDTEMEEIERTLIRLKEAFEMIEKE